MIELKTLGHLDARHAGEPLPGLLAQPKRIAVLVYLAVDGWGRFLRRDTLLGVFWPDEPEARARKALRQTLWKLKQEVGDGVLLTRGEDEIGVSPEAITCDVHAFDAAVRAEKYVEAASLYGGDFLRGFFLKGAMEFDHWLETERDRLARGYAQVLESLIEDAAEREDWHEAVEWCRRLASHNPYSTSIALTYMRTLAASGDRASALRYAERHTERMKTDLEADPSPQVEGLASRLRHDPTNPPEDA